MTRPVKKIPKRTYRTVVKEPVKFPNIPMGTHLNPRLDSLEYLREHKPNRLKKIMKRSKKK